MELKLKKNDQALYINPLLRGPTCVKIFGFREENQ